MMLKCFLLTLFLLIFFCKFSGLGLIVGSNDLYIHHYIYLGNFLGKLHLLEKFNVTYSYRKSLLFNYIWKQWDGNGLMTLAVVFLYIHALYCWDAGGQLLPGLLVLCYQSYHSQCLHMNLLSAAGDQLSNMRAELKLMLLLLLSALM